MTIRKKLYLMLFFVLFVIAAMTTVTYFRGRSAIVNLVDAAGMDTVKASAKAIDERFDTAFSVLDTCAEVVRSINVSVNQSVEAGEILATLS